MSETGSCATKIVYTIQKTGFQLIGYTDERAQVMALLEVAIGFNHRYEARYVESDRTISVENKPEWSTDRHKILIGDWQMTTEGMHLSGLGLVTVENDGDKQSFKFRAERDLISFGFTAQSFEFAPEVWNTPPFPDLDPCKK